MKLHPKCETVSMEVELLESELEVLEIAIGIVASLRTNARMVNKQSPVKGGIESFEADCTTTMDTMQLMLNGIIEF